MRRIGGKPGRVLAGDLLELSRLVARYLVELRGRGMMSRRQMRAGFAAATTRGLLRSTAARDGPEIATVVVTPRCPLDCWHCSAGVRQGEPLPREAVLDIIDALQRIDTSVIAFTGGEPLVCEHIVEYVERVLPPTGALIFSSGWKVDEETARRLSGRSNLLVVVSVDNLDPDVHDRQRGRQGSHERALATLELLRRHGIQREVSTLVTGERIRSGEFEHFLTEMRRLGIGGVQVFQPRPVGRLVAGEGSLLTAAEEEWMAELARRTQSDRRFPLILNYPYVESAGVLGCCGGTYRLYVDWRGEVCPCDFCPVSYGNVLEEPLDVIWRRMLGDVGHPGSECLAKANRGAFDGLKDGAKLAHAELESRGGLRVGAPAHVYERYGDAGYRFLLKYMYFTSRMFPRIDRRFRGEKVR